MRFIKRISKFNLSVLLILFVASGTTTSFILPIDKIELCAPHETRAPKFERCNHCEMTKCKSVFDK